MKFRIRFVYPIDVDNQRDVIILGGWDNRQDLFNTIVASGGLYLVESKTFVPVSNIKSIQEIG